MLLSRSLSFSCCQCFLCWNKASHWILLFLGIWMKSFWISLMSSAMMKPYAVWVYSASTSIILDHSAGSFFRPRFPDEALYIVWLLFCSSAGASTFICSISGSSELLLLISLPIIIDDFDSWIGNINSWELSYNIILSTVSIILAVSIIPVRNKSLLN